MSVIDDLKRIKKKALSITQAHNVLKDMRKVAKQEAKQREMPDPAIVDRFKNTQKLRLHIQILLPRGPMRTFMLMRVNGASTKEIAFAYNVPEDLVRYFEKKGIDMIKKGIEKGRPVKPEPKVIIAPR